MEEDKRKVEEIEEDDDDFVEVDEEDDKKTYDDYKEFVKTTLSGEVTVASNTLPMSQIVGYVMMLNDQVLKNGKKKRVPSGVG